MSTPDPAGVGAERAMRDALADARLEPDAIAYLNLHGTGTSLNDAMECAAVARVFPEPVRCSSTKSLVGHLLGAAGAIEAIASILSMEHSCVPPTINHSTVDDAIDPSLNLTLNKAQEREVNVAMSNTFGFGGHNACLLFGKVN